MNSIIGYLRDGWRYLLVIACVMAAVFGLMAYAALPVGPHSTGALIVVEKGDNIEIVGAKLAQRHLVRSGLAFAMLGRLCGDARRIRPGAYRFDQRMSAFDMLDSLSHNGKSVVWITVPEGFTAAQIAERVEHLGIGSRDVFMNLVLKECPDSVRNIVPCPVGSLEGYLFPSTYPAVRDERELGLIVQMLEAFKSKVYDHIKDELPGENVAAKNDYLYKIIIIASMVEREAKIEADRPLISAVIWNRLKKGMKLEVDATVVYAIGSHRQRLTYEDLRIDSPYNTYLYAGLPPGPICNPGLPSIRAALHPAKVDYLFYVAKPDGSHIFSRTFEEHVAAKRAVKKNEGG